MPAHLIAEEGPNKGLTLNLEEGDLWVVGRDPDTADFVVEDSTVSRKHSQLTKAPEGIYLKNLSRVNPTLVNDKECEEPVLLKEGDRVQIGNTLFLYSEKALPEKKAKKGYDDIFEELAETPSPPEESPKPEPAKREPSAYDTIFEEGEEAEEELPFPLIAEAPLLLKVIAGPNAGAEIGIEKGRSYVVGKDSESCDIVFQDMSVSRNHARISVDSEGIIELEDLGSKNGTVVNGIPISEKKIVTPQDLIAMGTTIFLIIDREAPQETIYSPIIPSYEAPKEEIAPPLEGAVEKKEVEEKDWKRAPLPTKHLIAAGSFVFVFLTIFLSFFSLFKSKGMEVVQKEPVQEVKEALKKFEAVQFSYNPGSGKLFLVGHVLTGVEYQEMLYRIGQIHFILSTEDNVVIDEGVSKAMNDVLSDNANWRGVNIRAVQPGKFVVSGYIQTNEVATALAEYLTVNFPYLDRLENRVVVEENLNTELQSFLIARGFSAISFQLANGEVILSGKYSNKMESEYSDLIKQINALNGVTSVKNFAIAAVPSQAAIDLTQQYQITGSSLYDGEGFSAILNGKIYTLGDAVDGMKITAIESNTILLEKDGIKYKIDYTR